MHNRCVAAKGVRCYTVRAVQAAVGAGDLEPAMRHVSCALSSMHNRCVAAKGVRRYTVRAVQAAVGAGDLEPAMRARFVR